MAAPSGTIETYRPNPGQAKFHADPAKIRLLLGAWRAGKTYALVWEAILLALEYPKSLTVVFRKTYPALRDSTKRDFDELIPRALIADSVKSEGRESYELTNGSQFWFRCLDDWKKLGSYSFDTIIVDEADQTTEHDFNMLAKGRLSGKIGPRRMVLATNPPNRDHWMYRRFQLEPEATMSIHHFTTYDNKEHLPDEYIGELEAMPEAWKRRFLYGEWGFLPEGAPVYSDFRESLHATPLAYQPKETLTRGWDFGFRHPACVCIQKLNTGHVNVIGEILGTNEDLPSFIRRVKTYTQQHFKGVKEKEIEDFCDVAGVQKNDLGSTAVQIMHDHDIWPYYKKLPLHRSVESLRYLLRTNALGRPLLQIDPERCRFTVEGFSGGYVMDAKRDEPLKDGEIYEHLMDALRVAAAPYAMAIAVDPGSLALDRKVKPITQPRVAI